ncbi:hypothetical protein N7474_004371 [Penicillium riverlandense]|uniref:uncharacterized protein n=1 Tax=Penicillium riverlandense TaxID=1903569 RepID=UPI0025491E71|nr:uncharacterized protein N7474_004371 [Penicillium riverlandense]KAJ5818780.1 hypothetical protein N7474_004371 [Penicillium riverlandense]
MQPLMAIDFDDARTATPTLREENKQDLLELDDPPEDLVENIGQQLTTKFWIPAGGVLGYFAGDRLDILPRIAEGTGTEVSVDTENGVRVFGTNSADVEEALERLATVEGALSLVDRPYRKTTIVAPTSGSIQYDIVSYAGLNHVALRRALFDPRSSFPTLRTMWVPVQYEFDLPTRLWEKPCHIRTPLRVEDATTACREWNEFTFPELGMAGAYNTDENMVPNIPVVATDGSQHPFLTAAKAQAVDDWVDAPDAPDGKKAGNSAPVKRRSHGLKTRKVLLVESAEGPAEKKEAPTKNAAVPPPGLEHVATNTWDPSSFDVFQQEPQNQNKAKANNFLLAQIGAAAIIQERLSPANEAKTREFHSTMHQTAKPSAKGKVKTAAKDKAKAKREAIVADAWGELPTEKAEKAKENDPPKEANALKTESAAVRKKQRQNILIETFFIVLKPMLTAAECYPGPLNLEIQLGLVLVPSFSTADQDRQMSFAQLQRLFLPLNGTRPPSTTFINRLTTCPADINYIVDLQVKGHRLFDQAIAESCVQYEIYCRTETGALLIITIDRGGDATVSRPKAFLGSVHLSFPGNIWDAAAILRGHVEYNPMPNTEIGDAVNHIVNSIWVEPNRSLVRLHFRLPKAVLAVQKVSMKRWTRHCFVPSNPSNEERTNANHDLFLQITEIQDLLLSVNPLDSDTVEASCAQLTEMVSTGRQWWEVSLVSPVINVLLKANGSLQPGDRTQDWTAAELLGRDIEISTTSTPVADAIGSGGLGDLLRATKLVVENIDPVGYYNNGPGAEAPKSAGASGASEAVATTTTITSASKLAAMPAHVSAASENETAEFW